MFKFFKTLSIILFITLAFKENVHAADTVDINTLIEQAKEMDGKTVAVEGEAIGEQLERGNYAWININDGTNAIGVWLSRKEADKISRYGNYKNIGDTIKITGIFNRACKEHNGEADIHCSKLEIVKNGTYRHYQVKTVKLLTAIFLTAASLLILIIYHTRYKNKTNA